MTSKGLTDVSSMSHSTEMARMDHGNDTGMYLGAEAARQRILQVDTGDRADTLRVHMDAHSTENDVMMPTGSPEK